MRSLKEIALDLLEEYKWAETSYIYEHSRDIRKDYAELANRVSAIRAEIYEAAKNEGSERDREQRTRRLIKKAYKAGISEGSQLQKSLPKSRLMDTKYLSVDRKESDV